MREIKFRAWDKVDEVMFDVGAIAWHSNVFDTKSYTFGVCKDKGGLLNKVNKF